MTPAQPELNSKDIRTVAYIMIVGVLVIILCLFWAARTMNAQEKPKAAKATGITLNGCKTVTVYLTTQGGHILAPMWSDKTTAVPLSNPTFCDYRGWITFYV